MVALLDANVLVALFDGMHVHHETAHAWFARNRAHGWATCPLTEQAVVRILSHPGYPGRRTTLLDAVERLRRLREAGHHRFWSDDLSLCDSSRFHPEHVAGGRQITDVYLLGLAVKNGGRLATFDRSIALQSVAGAAERNLAVVA